MALKDDVRLVTGALEQLVGRSPALLRHGEVDVLVGAVERRVVRRGAFSRTAMPPSSRSGTPSRAASPSKRSPSETMSSRISLIGYCTLGCNWNSTYISSLPARSRRGERPDDADPHVRRRRLARMRSAARRSARPARPPARTSGAVAGATARTRGAAIAAAPGAFRRLGGRDRLRTGPRRCTGSPTSCERRRDELARALTLDQGKPLHAEAYDEVDELVVYFGGRRPRTACGWRALIPPQSTPGKRVLLHAAAARAWSA